MHLIYWYYKVSHFICFLKCIFVWAFQSHVHQKKTFIFIVLPSLCLSRMVIYHIGFCVKISIYYRLFKGKERKNLQKRWKIDSTNTCKETKRTLLVMLKLKLRGFPMQVIDPCMWYLWVREQKNCYLFQLLLGLPLYKSWLDLADIYSLGLKNNWRIS